MPHFSSCCPGADTYICQKCARILCSKCQPPKWRPDITGNKSAGNICPKCFKCVSEDLSLFEHCRRESGLSHHTEIKKYMHKYYGGE